MWRCFKLKYCVTILEQLFDNENGLPQLENFNSKNGAKYYNLKTNNEIILMTKSSEMLSLEEYLYFNKEKFKIFEPNFLVYCRLAKCLTDWESYL